MWLKIYDRGKLKSDWDCLCAVWRSKWNPYKWWLKWNKDGDIGVMKSNGNVLLYGDWKQVIAQLQVWSDELPAKSVLTQVSLRFSQQWTLWLHSLMLVMCTVWLSIINQHYTLS
jgi:hypothetical protein